MSMDAEILDILINCKFPPASFQNFEGDTRALLRCMSLNDLESQLRASLLPSSSRSSLIAQFITALLSHEGENQIHEPIVPPIPAPTTTPPITISIKQEDVPQETRESSRKVTHSLDPVIQVPPGFPKPEANDHQADLIQGTPLTTQTNLELSRRRGKRQEEITVSSTHKNADQPESKVPKSESATNKIANLHGYGSKTPTFREMASNPLIDEINASLNSTSRQSAVKVECPSVRVGDYNCSTPHEVGGGGYPVVFSKRGLMFSLPHAQFSQKTVVCTLPLHKIFVVEANYSKSLPLLFLATGPRFAKDLRYLLGLSEDPENCGRYYDPVFGDKYQKRIVFLLPTITDQVAATINKIFGRTLNEIDAMKANQILCDITRDEELTTQECGLRRNVYF